VRAVGEDVGGLGVVETVVGVLDGAAVGDGLHVGHVAEGTTGFFDEVINWPEFADEPDGGGEDAERLPGFGRGGDVVVPAVADAHFVPVVSEVEDAVNGARDGGPYYVHTIGEGGAAEVADVGADVGPETWLYVHGEGFKPTARCGGGDVAGAREDSSLTHLWHQLISGHGSPSIFNGSPSFSKSFLALAYEQPLLVANHFQDKTR
jgi:hypothetical protein